MSSLQELSGFLQDQLANDEMSVVISFFEPAQINAQSASYLKYLRAGGAAVNSMVAFALSTSFDTALSLRIPAPLPVSVFFSPVSCDDKAPGTCTQQEFEMRRAKFFEDGQVFLDGQLPILAFVTSGNEEEPVASVRFPKSTREAMGYEDGVQWPEDDEEEAEKEEEGKKTAAVEEAAAMAAEAEAA